MEVLLNHPDVRVQSQAATKFSGVIHFPDGWIQELWEKIVSNLDKAGRQEDGHIAIDVLYDLKDSFSNGWVAKMYLDEAAYDQVLRTWAAAQPQETGDEVLTALHSVRSDRAVNIFLAQLDLETPEDVRRKVAPLWASADRNAKWDGLAHNKSLTKESLETLKELSFSALSEGYKVTEKGLEVLEICLERGLPLDKRLEEKWLNWAATHTGLTEDDYERSEEIQGPFMVCQSAWPQRFPRLWQALVLLPYKRWATLMALAEKCPQGGFGTWWERVKRMEKESYVESEGLVKALESLPIGVASEIDKSVLKELLENSDKEVRIAGAKLAARKAQERQKGSGIGL